MRLPRLFNLFYRSITTSHPSTFIQIPITHHPNSNNEVSHPSIHRRHHVPVQSRGYLGSRWASAAPVGLPATKLKSARRGRRWPPPSGEMPATLSLRNSPREEAPLAFPGHTALRLRHRALQAPCLPHLALKSPGEHATPGQSTKHPSQVNHPCSHSQACMPSVRSVCSPATQPGQPGHEAPRPVPVPWHGAPSLRRVRAGRRINGAGQALYHALCVLLPVRHAQRLVIRRARPFV